MKYITLSQGKEAIVDDGDCDWLSQWKWYAKRSGSNWYAVRSCNDRKKTIRMHCTILGPPFGMFTDHINGNGLDNRRCNMRICTNSQNQMNRKIFRGKSRFKGVKASTSGKPWIVFVGIGGNKFFIGRYDTEIEAAKAYNKYAKIVHGEFASLNKT